MSQVVRLDVIDNNLQRAFAGNLEIASKLQALEDSSISALEQSQRAIIDSEDKLGRAGDLSKAITGQLKTLEESRKQLTAPLDEAKKSIMDAFAPAKANFETAKQALQLKSSEFLRNERERREREAAEERARIAAEARRIAEEAADDGDIVAASEVIEAAVVAERSVQAAPVAARGGFGATVSGTRVVKGAVIRTEAFLRALLVDPAVRELSAGVGLDSIVEFKQSGLNKLAKAAADAKVSVDGLSISDTLEARSR
jgi:hypothetical protein